MARSKPIEALDCKADAAGMAAEVLRVRFEEMLEFHTPALEPDGVDGVHDMRVASRRFRSALRDFAPLFPQKAIKPLKKDVKEVADRLGAVRDHDVAIEALGALREKAPAEGIIDGIDLLIRSRQTQRGDAHARLLRHIDPDRLARLRSDLMGAVDVEKPGDKQTFHAFAVDAIHRAEKKLTERAEVIYDPFNDKALHKLRLSAKRLRYALELFDQCWMGELKPFAKYLSKIQSSLGKVHDSAEWIEYLRGSMIEENGADRQTAAWLISEFVSVRSDEYLKALELWNEWQASGLTRNLRDITGK